MNDNFIADSVQPKSDQLNADDLISGPIEVTIKAVKQGSIEQPVIVEIGDGRQPYKPSKSMRRLLISMFGDHPSNWIGKRLRLYRNDEIKFGGVRVGGIQISHATIPKTHTVLMTVARGKRTEYSVEPLVEQKKSPSDRFQGAIEAINKVSSLAELERYREKIEEEMIDGLSVSQRKQLMDALSASHERIEGL